MNQKVHMACNFNCLIETKDFSRSQAVTYMVNVVPVVSRKQFKAETMLLQTTNRK